mmetsp:Transcript_33688/g.76935  ORF Transcript_33688/g.76935 Transcript_33688/m.76935 type:complete len:271 (-) Transcript_33688:324-1136(-)
MHQFDRAKVDLALIGKPFATSTATAPSILPSLAHVIAALGAKSSAGVAPACSTLHAFVAASIFSIPKAIASVLSAVSTPIATILAATIHRSIAIFSIAGTIATILSTSISSTIAILASWVASIAILSTAIATGIACIPATAIAVSRISTVAITSITIAACIIAGATVSIAFATRCSFAICVVHALATFAIRFTATVFALSSTAAALAKVYLYTCGLRSLLTNSDEEAHFYAIGYRSVRQLALHDEDVLAKLLLRLVTSNEAKALLEVKVF